MLNIEIENVRNTKKSEVDETDDERFRLNTTNEYENESEVTIAKMKTN